VIEFRNVKVEMNSVPAVAADEFERLPNRYRIMRLSYLGLTAFVTLAIGVWVACNPVKSEEGIPTIVWIAGGVACAFLIIWGVEEILGFQKRGFLLRELDITYRSGFWKHQETTVPFSRIQHSEIVQGPLARIFGICTLKLFTAGSSGANLRIPGMDKLEAERMRKYIDERTAIR